METLYAASPSKWVAEITAVTKRELVNHYGENPATLNNAEVALCLYDNPNHNWDTVLGFIQEDPAKYKVFTIGFLGLVWLSFMAAWS